MTVQELINQLQAFPNDMRVVVSGYESGCDYVGTLEKVKVNLNVNNEWFYGKHQPDMEGEDTVLWLEAEVRNEEPTVEIDEGSAVDNYWHLKGELHRKGEPASEKAGGAKAWWFNGYL